MAYTFNDQPQDHWNGIRLAASLVQEPCHLYNLLVTIGGGITLGTRLGTIQPFLPAGITLGTTS